MVDDILVNLKLKLEADSTLTKKTADNELGELRRSLTFVNKTIEEMTREREQLKAANETLVARNQQLERRVTDMEQYSRKSNVEIKGVPTTKGADCVKIIQAIGNKIECPVSESDLDIVHCVPSKGVTKNLIARFLSRTKKEFVMKARKARLEAKGIGFHGMEQRKFMSMIT
ncbi:hypothetical protein HPB48_013328 [Haemaphysalis longicornis]|uniref:Uncharacterized protein n=1 Tax=Haemaphysalis longicornis TaxID=44386 RepID=A0A9J6H1N7_HAELO|nr:hypothetical protein HPB48_013328 [Haemaphysalis longicornis]